MMAARPTWLNAICWGECLAVVAIGMEATTRSGYDTAHWSACIPPIEPPVTARRRSIPRWSTRRTWAPTMSFTVMMGNDVPYSRPVAGLTDDGPVLPWHPPITLEQMTKYLSVSNAFPGPIVLSHHPGFLSSSAYRPAAWESPERACRMRIAFVLSRLSRPYVS